jgi:hypothetical protein
MSEVPNYLYVKAAASIAASPGDAVTGNTLIVVEYPGEENWRVYWKGQQVGTIDYSRPVSRSTDHPRFTMLIDGRQVAYGNPANPTAATFTFQGETLYNHGGGFRVKYDAATNRPVF